MLNKRKSYIHTYNYNKFLAELDKKSKNNHYKDQDKDQDKDKDLLDKPIIEKINIHTQIHNISHLIQLIDKYPLQTNIQYNINMNILHKIKEPLIQLNNMVGLNIIKENIVDQILFYIQNLQNTNHDFMHTVIYGPPGTGKTEIAKIIGSIFSKIGILKKGTFKKVTKSDLVAGYLGQTALKTRDVIKESLGGVLFIDEAYSLGNYDKIDSFSKECVDTLCEALSDHKDNLMVIVAGYENELNDCFFNINQGLDSRFTWRFHIDEYNAQDLYQIFYNKVYQYGWTIHNDITVKWFQTNKSHFTSYGRDIETLLTKVKIAHSRRIFCNIDAIQKQIILCDLDKGFEVFIKHKNKQKSQDKYNKLMQTLYT